MSRPISPELVLCPDFLSFAHPSVLLFCFLASRDECPGSLCHSPGVGVGVGVCAWTKTLTSAITFLPEVIWFSYYTCVFLMTRPFTWYHNCTSWPWPWSLAKFWKTLTLLITFLPEVTWISYNTCVFIMTRSFTWYHTFWPRNPDLEVWPTFKKL